MKQTKNQRRSAFTLTELLAINAVAVALAATVLPALTQANGGARQALCAANKRQLGLAWLMYAADNRGVLVHNNGGDAAKWNAPPTVTSWANGWEDFSPNTLDNTNVMDLIGTGSPLTGTQFGTYVKNINIYKCPCDKYTAPIFGTKMPRLRSVSMNAFVGDADESTTGGWVVYHKLTDITAPPPALLWVITDEHPDSINDAWFTVDPAAIGFWGDLPGSYHSAGNVMVFADGHAEYHKWMDGYNASTGSGTVQPVLGITYEGFADEKQLDTRWFYARMSAPLY
jgi:type II secretory pathway pseudopilin PulG